MTSIINFIHIPKTAGTSFRNAFEQKYGLHKVLRDYAENAVETSAEIYSAIYKNKDFFEFSNHLENADFVLLSGHYSAIKYARISTIENMITFVRNPISRIVSEYKHFQRHKNYKDSIEAFIEMPRNINVQYRMLHHVPISSIGFIGITEYYEKSLELINELYNIDVPYLKHNTAPSCEKDDSLLSVDILEKISALNDKDIKLYKELVDLYKKRIWCYDKKQPYTYGQFQIQEPNRLCGWAFQKENEKAIDIDIYWHNQLQLEIKAFEYNMLMDSFNCPRKGYIGFNIPLPENVDVATINCIVKSTQQPLVNRIV